MLLGQKASEAEHKITQFRLTALKVWLKIDLCKVKHFKYLLFFFKYLILRLKKKR